jgi:hypothetical protein
MTILNNNEKNNINMYLSKFKLKSEKINRYKYWKILLKFENIYINTKKQDLIKIEKFLIKLNSTVNEDELNKI